jgi:hypothetical protein
MLIKKGKYIVLAALLLLAFTQVASAKLSAVGPVLPDTDPTAGWSVGYNGFPMWYRDKTGLTLQLPNPPNQFNIPFPVDPLNPFSVQIGFDAEAMWWFASATTAVPDGVADLVLALEAAFGGGAAADKDQITFARVRFRIDAAPGTYRVTYPYGIKTFVVPAGTPITKAINDTSDVGIGAPGVFNGAIQGAIGPFLTQVSPAPVGVGAIGDGVLATVTGSPLVPAANFFKIERETSPGVFTQIGLTNQFNVWGQKFPGTAFAPVAATYSRDAAGNTVVSAFARRFAPILAAEKITVSADAGIGPFNLTVKGLNFFATQALGVVTTPLPATLNFTGLTNAAPATATTLTRKLTDVVTIRQADWSAATQTLTVTVDTSDLFLPQPQLTLTGLGFKPTLVVGRTGTVTLLAVPPTRVTVTSAAGGKSSAPVSILP